MAGMTVGQFFTRRHASSSRVALGTITLFATMAVVAQNAAPQSSHAALDWAATYRWVHVDNIAAERTQVFEAARHGWLNALKQGDSLLADGRPLFWEQRGDDRSTFYTFYPFGRFGELDARREAVLATQRIVGKEALDRYDSASIALVDDTNWVYGGGASKLNDLLGNVTAMVIRADFGDPQGDEAGLDNVQLIE